MNKKLTLIDCTLRDGGYYNNWDFSKDLIVEYLAAMQAAAVDYVELGFRSFETEGFRGPCAYTTDKFIRSLRIPAGLKIGVMMNASELLKHPLGPVAAADLQFCQGESSPVSLVRFACHVHEFEPMLSVCAHLKAKGYTVGINLMQVSDRSDSEIESIGNVACGCPLDVLYFADSLGSLTPERAAALVRSFRVHWRGEMGIHTHDNMGRALANTFRAADEGVTWIDSTITGMGRGPGNAQTEYVAIEVANRRGQVLNLTPLLSLIRRHFAPLKAKCGWGENPYYYLSGLYGIHPTYVQEMLGDPRYGESEILSVLEHLRVVGGKKFNPLAMEDGRQMYGGAGGGTWEPASLMRGREVLILGAGSTIAEHRDAIEAVIKDRSLFVIALNTQQDIDSELVHLRAACHPFRLRADCIAYRGLPQPMVLPQALLPDDVNAALSGVDVRDFGLVVKPGVFEFHSSYAVIPSMLVAAYALGLATSGEASRIFMAGFDGFAADDSRFVEMAEILASYQATSKALPLLAITPTRHNLPTSSVYAL